MHKMEWTLPSQPTMGMTNRSLLELDELRIILVWPILIVLQKLGGN